MLYGGYDFRNLEFIGKGTQGSVYKIEPSACIKVFKRRKICETEVETLRMAQGNSHFPRMYSWSDRYIIRELINGDGLDKYLRMHPLTIEISKDILEIYEAMKRIGYKRLDTTLFHIFINEQGQLKVIDTARAMIKKSIYPSILLKGLKGVGYKEQFLQHVQSVRPDIYKEWSKSK